MGFNTGCLPIIDRQFLLICNFGTVTLVTLILLVAAPAWSADGVQAKSSLSAQGPLATQPGANSAAAIAAGGGLLSTGDASTTTVLAALVSADEPTHTLAEEAGLNPHLLRLLALRAFKKEIFL